MVASESPVFALIREVTINRMHPLVAIPFVGFVLWLIVRLTRRAFHNLPPGPKGLPFIGDIPHAADQVWLSSPQRKDDYGDTLEL